MHRSTRVAVSALLLLVVSACFHATITTGRPESSTVIEKPWASSFIFGLVPPDVLDVSSECKSGVAKVETQHSFLNGLVAFLTFQIYTPMTLTVTCAGSGGAMKGTASIELPATASPAEQRQAISEAAKMARESGSPVFVKF